MLWVVKPNDRWVRGDSRTVTIIGLATILKGRLVLLDRHNVVIAKDSPEVIDLVPVDRLVLAHPRVSAVRVLHIKLPIEEIWLSIYCSGHDRAS